MTIGRPVSPRALPLALALLLSVRASGQKPVELIRSANIKANVVFLSADEMAGRKTGSREAKIAAN